MYFCLHSVLSGRVTHNWCTGAAPGGCKREAQFELKGGANNTNPHKLEFKFKLSIKSGIDSH